MSLHLSKCHVVGNHMSRLKLILLNVGIKEIENKNEEHSSVIL